MDNPAWEETQPVDAEPSRAPASAPSAAPPAFEDTTDVPVETAPSWDETTDLQSQYGTPGQQALAGLEGAGRGIAGPVFTGAERLLGGDPTAMRLREEANPWTAGLLEAGAFAGTTYATLGTSAEARAALEAGEIGAKAAQGTSALAKVAKYGTVPGLVGQLGEKVGTAVPFLKTSARLGTELMALQGGSELSKAIEQDPNQTAQSALSNIGLSGVIGLGIGVPLGAASSAWEKLSGQTAQKLLEKIKVDWGFGEPLPGDEQILSPGLKANAKFFYGVPLETMEEYAYNRNAIRAAPEFPEVYGHAVDFIKDMNDNLSTKQASVAEAKSAFNDFLNQQRTALRQAGYDAAAADRLAKVAAKEASDRIAIGLQNGAIEAGPQAYGAVEKLRQNVFDLSAGARDILDKTPGTLSLKPFTEAVRGMQDELYSRGFPELAEGLGKQSDVWGAQYGDAIPYSEAKNMIQGLQMRGKWSMNATHFDNGLAPYYNRLRFVMDDALKDAVPAYREAMKPTADARALLKKLARYGTPEGATTAVKGLSDPFRYANEMPLLRDLESKTGTAFADPIESYANPEVREKMVQATPEYKESLKTAAAWQQLKDPETQAALQKAPYLSKEALRLEKAKTVMEQQLQRMSAFNGITENTIESKLKSVKAGKNITAAKALEKFPEMPGMEGMTIPEVLNLIHIREAFEKNQINGSRMVNMMAKTGGSLGGAIGAITGLTVGHPFIGGQIGATLGGGAGALYGGYLDKEGPRLAMEAIDRYIDKFGDGPKVFGTTADNFKGALLHFLGRDVPPNAEAFKSTVNYIDAQKKGSVLLKNGVQSIFNSSKTIPNHIWTTKDNINKLDEKTKAIKANEQGLLNTGGGLGHYMPDHGAAIAKAAANAVNYINQNRPMTEQNAPLDEPMDPTPEQEYSFQRGLELAEQPMSIIKRIKDDTILPEDIQHLSAMYPEYYQHMKNEITDAMTQHLSDGKTIPYNLRQNLSLFLGETLDSSMSPPNIQAAQGVFMAQKAAAMPAPAAKTQKLAKASESYQTKDQSALSRSQAPA